MRFQVDQQGGATVGPQRARSSGPRATPPPRANSCLEEWTAGLWGERSWARGLWSDERPAPARSPDEAFPMMRAAAALVRPRGTPRVEARIDALLQEAHAALERMRARAHELREALREARRERPSPIRGTFRVEGPVGPRRRAD